MASVWGLAIGIYVLVVATGARRAAEQARRKFDTQSLAEEFEAATHKIQEIGHFLSVGNCEVVRIRAEEVSNTCQSTLGRWGNDPMRKRSKNNVILAARIMRSIAERAAAAPTNPFTQDESVETKAAQLRAGELLHTVLGELRGLQGKE